MGDAFTVRDATADDHEAIVELNTEVFDRYEGAAVRHLLEGGGGYGPGEWTVAVDTDGRIVSACTLFQHRLQFGSVELPAAQIEFVATRPEARKAGLVRRQFERHHARVAELGALVIVITGIPYLYRRLGYGYAFVDGRVHRVVTVPEAPEGWTIADATVDDVDAITAEYDRAATDNEIALRHPAEAWRWLVEGAPTWDERVRLARRGGVVEGIARTQVRTDQGYYATWGSARTVGAAEALLADAATAADGLKFYAVDRHADPWGSVVRQAGVHDPSTFEAVYARIPDPVAFLDAIRPVLSERLTASGLAQESGELALSLYDDGVVIAYERGEVTEVRRDPEPALDPLDDDDAGVPPDVFPALVFGRFTTEELALRHDDVGYVKDRALMDVLFPKQHVDLIAPV
jgi:predicted N-acetyltransferase YhbS